MTDLTRRRFVLGATSLPLVAGAGGARGANKAEFVYKYGNDVPPTHPVTLRAQEAASRILEESGGRLEIRVFPNNQLGGSTDLMSQLRSGALEMFTLSGSILATLAKPTSINAVGYAFPDRARVWDALDGELGRFQRGVISKLGLHALERVWENGFRQITTSTHPIHTPEDLRGFKIRVPVSPQAVSLFKALGAAPTAVNLTEVYSALQTRVVDGQENSLQLIELSRFQEVQKYVSITNHSWDGFFFTFNARAWSRLPSSLQAIVAKHMNAAALAQRDDMVRLNAASEEKLRKAGLVFNATDPARFRATLSAAGYYRDWKSIYGAEAWSVLERYAGPLA